MLSNRWLVLSVLFAARTSIAFQFQSVAAITPYLIEPLALNFAVLGALIGCYLLPGVALALPGGLLGQRFGSKRLVIFGLMLMVGGGVLMANGSVPALFVGRVISGAGAVLLNVLVARMVADWFAAEELVAVMGTLVASWPLGIALALVSLPTLAAASGWPNVMLAAATPSLVCLVLLAVVYRDPPHSPHRVEAKFTLDLTATEIALVCVAGLIWGLYNAAYVVVVSGLPEFFVVRGYAPPIAAAVTSAFGWVLILSLPLGGCLAQRIGYRSASMIGCFLASAAAAFALVFTEATVVSVLVLVIVIGLPAGLVMALPAEVLRPESRSSGMGVFFTVFYVAMATLPAVAGLVRERTGEVGSPLLLGAAMMGAAAAGVLVFGAMRRGRPPECDPPRVRQRPFGRSPPASP